MNYHISHLVLSSLCVGAFVAAGIWWCSFCRLKLQPAKRTPPNTSCNKSSNTQRTENKTADVVIQQHSCKLLMMDILMSETCWAHNKWNKISSDIKLVFHSSSPYCMFGSAVADTAVLKMTGIITIIHRITSLFRTHFLVLRARSFIVLPLPRTHTRRCRKWHQYLLDEVRPLYSGSTASRVL